jgi:uncharacterized membrane protein
MLGASLLSGLVLFVLFGLILQQPEWILGSVVPTVRAKQLATHWLNFAGGTGLAAVILVSLACLRRRFPDDLTVALENPWRRILRSHSWLLFLLAPVFLALVRPDSIQTVIPFVGPWLTCLGISGWLSGLWTLARPGNPPASPTRMWCYVVLASCGFAIAFGSLAILQYRALLVPHGDAGMYEEHLWNFLHGKGFRSQLDDGRLFLGEHIEAIHLLLVPIYWIKPMLPTLNACQALGLASGALAVFGLSRAISLPIRASAALACGYLCYFPLQYLSLEATWKTFRPETLGVPIVLWALWALETQRYRAMFSLLLVSFLAKEEFALVAAGIGGTLIVTGKRRLGMLLTILSLSYLMLALQVMIPFFRGGAPPHYTPYFASFGNTPAAIIRTMVLNPSMVFSRILQPDSLQFLVQMLVPWLLLPLLSWRRFLVAMPVFGYLLLADRSELRQPWFHFHAPLVAILPWCAAWGLRNLSNRGWLANRAGRFVLLMCVTTTLAFGRGPLSYRFWEPLDGIRILPPPAGSTVPYLFEPMGAYWRDLYLQSPRSTAFSQAQTYVRPEDRVASTDYIRSRFTHCQAAYDYPRFRGHVTIDDIDVFVLDRTEGWWGRNKDTNPDHELLDVMNRSSPVGTKLRIRGKSFVVTYHDHYFLVVRKSS